MASTMAASVRADLRICANSSFQLILWAVSSSKLLPDNVEQYLTHEHDSFHLATKSIQNVIGEPLRDKVYFYPVMLSDHPIRHTQSTNDKQSHEKPSERVIGYLTCFKC